VGRAHEAEPDQLEIRLGLPPPFHSVAEQNTLLPLLENREEKNSSPLPSLSKLGANPKREVSLLLSALLQNKTLYFPF